MEEGRIKRGETGRERETERVCGVLSSLSVSVSVPRAGLEPALALLRTGF